MKKIKKFILGVMLGLLLFSISPKVEASKQYGPVTRAVGYVVQKKVVKEVRKQSPVYKKYRNKRWKKNAKGAWMIMSGTGIWMFKMAMNGY